MDVVDLPGTIGIEGVRAGQGDPGERRPKFGEVARPIHGHALGKFPALGEPGDAGRDRATIQLANDWPVMGPAESVTASLEARRGLHLDRLLPFSGRPVASAVAIVERRPRPVEGLEVAIDRIGIVVGMAPAEIGRESGADVGSAKDGESIDIEPFLAVEMGLVALSAPKEADVRINQQHGIAGRTLRRSDRPHVRPLGGIDRDGSLERQQTLEPIQSFRPIGKGRGADGFANPDGRHRDPNPIESAETPHAAGGEDVPGFDPLEQPRPATPRTGIELAGQIVVDAGGVSVANGAEGGGQPLVLLLREPLNLEGAVEPVIGDALLTAALCRPSDRAKQILLELPEVVLTLSVHEAKDGRGIGLSEDVRNAKLVTVDRHLPGEGTLDRSRRSDPLDAANGDGRVERLLTDRRLMDPADDLHPRDDAPEGGKTLPVRVALSAKIELRLVTDADEEVRGRRIRTQPRHRDHPVKMAQPGHTRPFEPDRGIPRPLPGRPGLDHFDLDRTDRLVVRIAPDRAVESPARIMAAIDIPQKVGRRHRRAGGVDGDHDRSQFRLDPDLHLLRALRSGRTGRSRQGETNGHQKEKGEDRHKMTP